MGEVIPWRQANSEGLYRLMCRLGRRGGAWAGEVGAGLRPRAIDPIGGVGEGEGGRGRGIVSYVLKIILMAA
jgi:hypothetical protein